MSLKHIPIGPKLSLLVILFVSGLTAGIQGLIYLYQPEIFQLVSAPVAVTLSAALSAVLTGITLLLLTRRLVDKPLERQNRHLILLYDIARLLSESVASEDAYQEILDIVGCMLDYDELVLLLHQPQSDTLKVAATYGLKHPNDIVGMEFAAGEGVTGAAIAQRAPISIPNTRNDERYLYYKGLKPEDVSFLTVPLLDPAGDKAIGTLNVSRPADKPFGQHERETVQAVSNLVSLALRNGNLYGRLKELSVRDELTGLYNRRDCDKTIQRELIRATRFKRQLSVLMIDIDHFKKFNDRYGHQEGDKMLQEFAALLKASLRDVDYISRWGGEEFLVILPSTEPEGALNAAEKIRRRVSQHSFDNLKITSDFQFTVSIGVATFPDDGKTAEELVSRADQALYTAKGGGRNRVIVAGAHEKAKQKVV